MTSPVDIYLFRGLSRCGRHWGDFVPFLESQSFCRKVYCIDLPGAGRFNKLSAPLTVSEMAEFVNLQIADRDSPKILFAVSLGAMTAVELIKKQPQLFEAVILVNTSFKNLSSVFQRLQPFSFQQFAKIVLAKDDNRKKETEALRLISNRPELWPPIVDLWTEIAETTPMSYKNVIRQLIAANGFSLPSSVPTTPIHILRSMGDKMVHPSCSEKFAEHWGLELRTHQSAGHDICIDDSQWVVDQISEILASH